MRYVAGGSTWKLVVDDLTVESYGGETMPPGVWCSGLGPSGGGYIQLVDMADQIVSDPTIEGVRLEGSHTADQMRVDHSGRVTGAHFTTGNDSNNLPLDTTTLALYSSFGIERGKLWGDTNVTRNWGPPVANRFNNLYPARSAGVPIPIASLWRTSSAGSSSRPRPADQYPCWRSLSPLHALPSPAGV